ncbi:50S ribosomal protein L20 [Algisphaera agarilytica]|uniref:Large ribosomal subunit protein bL20 n=1 Tax=Algisphaera agarilytica TaxID=1385975 RepID=A0A7X0LKA2_9BACT|nr:50S ribosomal protein L20 [Algisphaera agarilytica]MBB6430215.1 large subunit ribosomal protein L20 [Algisphaera agarilytica]
MPRAQKGAARRQAKNRWFKKAKGNRGARRTQWRRVQEAVVRAGVNQYRDRRLVKREYRALWITRISAACKQRGINYSRFIAGLKAANIGLNRKMLSEIAIHEPAAFDTLVETATQALGQPAAAA